MGVWRRFPRYSLLAGLLGSVSLPVMAQELPVTVQEMEDITPIEDALYSYARAISADGSAVIGQTYVTLERDGSPYTSYQAFRWSADGWQVLGSLRADGTGYSDAFAINADGSVIVGSAEADNQDIFHHNQQAFRWTPDGMEGLGTLRTDVFGYSHATDVSADGSVVVGDSDTDTNERQAFRWTSNGMMGLGTLQSDNAGHSYARAVSDDGLVVIGEAAVDPINGQTYSQAYRWTSDGMMGLGTLRADNSGYSSAQALTGDGTVVVGNADTDLGQRQAFRWTAAGMEGLGSLRSDNNGYSYATAVSADGNVVVGQAEIDQPDGGMHFGNQAFRWTEGDGMRSLGTLRTDGSGYSYASAVNADGSVVVGTAQTETSQQAFFWTASGMVGLGSLKADGSGYSSATGVSADGSIVVGQAETEAGTQRAFVYRVRLIDPTPVEPTPVEPTPVDPTPVEPTPVDPTPVEPTPVDPAPVEPTPVDPIPVNPTPLPPTPVDPAPVDPSPVPPAPVDPAPVDPTPVEPTPVNPAPVQPIPTPPGTMLDLENTQATIVQAAQRQERLVENRSTALVSLLGSELDMVPLAGPGLNGRLSTKGDATLHGRRPLSVRLDGTLRTGGGTEDMGIAGATAATSLSPKLTLGGSVRRGESSEGDAVAVSTYIRSREAEGTGLTWRGAVAHSSGDVELLRDSSLSNTEIGKGETSVRSYAASAEVGYGITQDRNLFTPFARITYLKSKRDGYSEAATVDFPVTYEDYTLTTTTLTLGIDGRQELSASSRVRFGAGVEFDVYRSDDMLKGTSQVPGLESISLDAPAVKNEARPYVKVGISRALTNGSILSLDVGAQVTSYSNQPNSYIAAGYQMNF